MDKFFNLDKSAETRRNLHTHTHTHTGSFLKTIFLIFMLCPVSVFATDVSGGETCDTDVLNTDTGPVNLRAEFEPETINLRWYNNNTLVNVTSAQGECTYDSPITLPTDPVKPGYKFKGWKVRPEYDFSTLQSGGGTEAWGKTGTGACWYGDRRTGSNSSHHVTCNSDFADLEYGELKNSFNYGTIYGMSMCSSTVGTTRGESGTPVETSNGTYCWCKVTGYIPTGANAKYAPNNTSPWVYCHQLTTNCKAGCADWCAWSFVGNSGFMQNTAFGH